MAGRGVHAAGAVFERDVVRRDDLARHAFEDGLLVGDAHELFALRAPGLDGSGGREEASILTMRGLVEDLLPKCLRHDAQAAVGLDGDVVRLGRERHASVRRERPGGRGPDHHVDGHTARSECVGHVDELEADEDRGARLVGILNLGLGERRVAVLAPVHGFATAIDHAGIEHGLEDLDIGGIVLVVEREVRMIPIAEHA